MGDRPTLNRNQRAVMDLLHHRAKNPGGVGYACLTSEATWADGTTAFINFRTAEALERRGLVRIEWFHPEGGDVYVVAPRPDGLKEGEAE